MSHHKIILIFFLLILEHAYGNFSISIHDKTNELRKKSNLMYGESTRQLSWDTDNAELEYPSDNKQRADVASLWLSYYECLARQLDSLTKKRNLPSRAVVAYEGATARLPCMCVSPDERGTWMYAKSLNNPFFTPLEERDNIVEERDALSIYNVGSGDAGVYACQIGGSVSGPVVLEVVDDEYDVVKPLTSHGPYASPNRTLGNEGLTLFSSWTEWSECSTCGAVGRRRRFGMCYVKPTGEEKSTVNGHELFNKNATKIFEDFLDGLPCRSEYLPDIVRSLPQIRERRNEIMIGLCKVPCKKSPKEDYEAFFTQQPNIVRNIVFAKTGQTVKLRCPGTMLRVAPYSWRVGGAPVCARALAAGSAGRARLDARDRLVLAPATRSDTALYSCGVNGKTAGHIVLIVK